MIFCPGYIEANIFHWQPLTCLTCLPFWQSNDFNIYVETWICIRTPLRISKNCLVARKQTNIRGLYFSCIFSIFSFANLFVNFAIIRNSQMNWKICLFGIFHTNPYYKFLKWYTYSELYHFIAHIFPYNFLIFFGNSENLMVLRVDTSSRWELETLCHTLPLYWQGSRNSISFGIYSMSLKL